MFEKSLSAFWYLSAYFFVIVFVFFSEKLFKNNDKKVALLFSLASILVLSFIAGVRGNTVGYDIAVYVIPNMNDVYFTDNYIEAYSVINGHTEFLYVFLVYMITRFTDEAGILLFVLQFLSFLPIIILSIKLRNRISMVAITTVYLFMFYNVSLNLMRHCVACSFILLGALHLYEQKRYSKIIMNICFLIAILFHKASFLGIGLVFLVYILNRSKYYEIYKKALYAVIIIFPIWSGIIVDFLYQNNLLFGNFRVYAEAIFYKTIVKESWFLDQVTWRFIFADIFFRVMNVLLPYFCIENIKFDNNKRFVADCCMFGVTIYSVFLITFGFIHTGRITLPLDYFLIIFFAMALKNIFSLKSFLICSYMLMYWLIWVIYGDFTGTGVFNFRF